MPQERAGIPERRLNVEPGARLPVHVWGVDQRGEVVDLEELRGRKVLLAFYIEDEAGGETRLTRALEDHAARFAEAGVAIVGVRGDRLATREARDVIDALPFPLLEDRNYRFGAALDIFDPAGERPARALVLLDEEGRVAGAWDHARAEHVEQAFRSVQDREAASVG